MSICICFPLVWSTTSSNKIVSGLGIESTLSNLNKLAFRLTICISIPNSSMVSLIAVSIGFSLSSMCPPGGSHSLTLLCQCKKILFLKTTKTVDVKCLIIVYIN